MKKTIFPVLLVCLFFISCDTEPGIYLPSKPQPVVYAIFDDHDSIHNILLTKSFGIETLSGNSFAIYDSLYFPYAEVTVSFKRNSWSSWNPVEVSKVLATEKDSGLFAYPEQEYYQFQLKLLEGKSRLVDSLRITVEIPDYELIESKIRVIDSIGIVTPKFAQHYIYLVPESPLRVIWDKGGHAWSEIDIAFEFVEETISGQRSKFVTIQNTQSNLSPYEKYRELNITYEELIREILLQLQVDDQVMRTYLGFIHISISGGEQDMVDYQRYLYGFSDYNLPAYSNITGGHGLITTATHFRKDSMEFDYQTRQTLLNENRLKKFKISPWDLTGDY